MNKHMENVNDVRAQFIEKISDSMNAFGVSASVGRILGIIYMNEEPMTLDELSLESGMSKTRMSQVVREMIDMNIAERVYKKGVRKDLFQVEKDHYQTFITLFNDTWKKAVTRNRNFEQRVMDKLHQLENTSELTAEEEQATNDLLVEIRDWVDYLDWVRRVAEFFESGEVFKHVPRAGNEKR